MQPAFSISSWGPASPCGARLSVFRAWVGIEATVEVDGPTEVSRREGATQGSPLLPVLAVAVATVVAVGVGGVATTSVARDAAPAQAVAAAVLSSVPVPRAYVPRTELGRRIMALRARLAAEGVPFLSQDEIRAEVAARRSERG